MGLGNHLTENIYYSPDGVLTNNGTWEYKPFSGMDIPLDIRVCRVLVLVLDLGLVLVFVLV
jgi:hypothetical protein